MLLGFCLGWLLLAMFCLAPGRFYWSPRRSGILVTFHLLEKYFLGFDEVVPGHISGPRSGGNGLHLHFESERRVDKSFGKSGI